MADAHKAILGETIPLKGISRDRVMSAFEDLRARGMVPKKERLAPVQHPKRTISHGEWSADVDEEIAELILATWEGSIPTISSCQNVGESSGDSDLVDMVHITFPTTESAQKWFEMLIAGGLPVLELEIDRDLDVKNCWQWSMEPFVDVANERVDMSFQVFFPKADLENVVRALREHVAIKND